MAIFEIERDALCQLSEKHLEELIARLAEAELVLMGNSSNGVRWSGSVDAPDGSVDVRVIIPEAKFVSGFLKRENTIFQAKRHKMEPSRIKKEMHSNNALASAISQQANIGGSYIIVSLADNCTEPMRESRINAMKTAMGDDPNKDKIDLDFYDRSKLHQWLRRHHGVVLWVRDILGQPLSGWKPYGQWSHLPDDDDSFIMAPGVSVTLPGREALSGKEYQELTIEDAIDPLRDLVRSAKIVRIIGLSGVGKTRIVQALFEDSVGVKPLDRTIAIYTNMGTDPNPSASAMLERLIHEGRKAILVVDNCSPHLHSVLTNEVENDKSNVKLITIEYDIREDVPQATEVVHIKTDGTEVAKRLLCRRFPAIGLLNAQRIAEFANGNARVSLVLAEGVKSGQSLAHLSDADLFDRLFFQDKGFSKEIHSHAGLLSLVYSFSAPDDENNMDELPILGSFFDVSRSQLFNTVEYLHDQHIIQKRGDWRSILPHAIANRLADEALKHIPIDKLRSIFEAPGNERLLTSFAHRLGFMHNHSKAQKIITAWLQEDGLLGEILNLDENGAKCLKYIAPVAPDEVLARIEGEINSPAFAGMESIHRSCKSVIIELLISLAYESSNFERCVNLLLRITDFEDSSKKRSLAHDSIIRFFQPHLSGTHASLDQRVAVLRSVIGSERQDFGFKMLSRALRPGPWRGSVIYEFGARSRDFGWKPNPQELMEWFSCFIDIAVKAGLDGAPNLASSARSVLAQAFRRLWLRYDGVRGRLAKAARDLQNQQPWLEGWREIRLLTSSRKNEDIDESLARLQMELVPKGLVSEIKIYATSDFGDLPALDDQFDEKATNKFLSSHQRVASKAREHGEQFARSEESVSPLEEYLFSTPSKPLRQALGEGLAMGALNKQTKWDELITALHSCGENKPDVSVLRGFIKQINAENRLRAQEFLDQCFKDNLLCRFLVELHPIESFDEQDLERCTKALELPEVGVEMFGCFFYEEEFNKLPRGKLIDLADQILEKPNGDDVLLDALSMKIYRERENADPLGKDFRRIGLKAARIKLLGSWVDDKDASVKATRLEEVIKSAFAFPENRKYKIAWFDAIFVALNRKNRALQVCAASICLTASKMPEEFLDRILALEKNDRNSWKIFTQYSLSCRKMFLDTDPAQIIDWCRRQDEPDAWKIAAECIYLWCPGKEGDPPSFRDAAIRLLEAAPNHEVVLEAYADKIWFGFSSENLTEPIEKQVAAFVPLFELQGSISSAARRIHNELLRSISVGRERGERFLYDLENRFE